MKKKQNINNYMRALYILPLSVMLAACTNSSDEASSAASGSEAEELPMVEISQVFSQSVPQQKTYTANVEAFNSNNISPQVMNRIESIRVDVGDHVTRGQQLVTFDATNAEQQKVNIQQLQVQVDNAKVSLDRAQELVKIGAGTQQQLDNAEVAYKGALSQLQAAKTQYANTVRNTTLTSPITGVVTARNYDPGDMTSGLPVLVVGQISPNVKVKLNVSENDLGLIRQGMPVDVTFDAYPDEEFQASISRIYPSVDAATRTFPVEIQIPNPGERIKPGMFARVNINLGSNDNVVVPDRAVVKQTGSGNRYVYVWHDGTVSYNKVELGQRIGNTYEVLSGVTDGDTVVISGQTRLADGVKAQLLKK